MFCSNINTLMTFQIASRLVAADINLCCTIRCSMWIEYCNESDWECRMHSQTHKSTAACPDTRSQMKCSRCALHIARSRSAPKSVIKEVWQSEMNELSYVQRESNLIKYDRFCIVVGIAILRCKAYANYVYYIYMCNSMRCSRRQPPSAPPTARARVSHGKSYIE